MMAAINQADLLQRQGKYAEALAVFDSLEKSAPESLRPAILEGQAMSAELAGKLDRALAAYESIATSLGDAANNGYFQAKIAELKARMAS
jgi:tetratricopeptide (TPR) repeat protein